MFIFYKTFHKANESLKKKWTNAQIIWISFTIPRVNGSCVAINGGTESF